MSYSSLYFKSLRYLVPVINSVLGVLLGYYLATVILGYARPIPALPQATVNLTPQHRDQALTSQMPADVQRIIAARLFGQAPPAQVVQAPPPPQEAPETKLNLKLQGILHSDDQRTARALIRLDDGSSAVLCVGDPIRKQQATDTPRCTSTNTTPAGQIAASTPVVSAIYADKVLILRNARHETLPLAGSDATQQRQLLQYTPRSAETAPAGPGGSAKLADYRRQILQNPGNLAQYIRMQPAQQNGQFIGYALQPGREAGILEEFGLQAGDVVTAVNGIVLDSPFKMDVLQQLTQASSVNLQILRNGSTLSMNLSATP